MKINKTLLLFLICNTVLANALVFTVTNTLDSGSGSLRQAIIDANQNMGADEINFNIDAADCNSEGICHIIISSALPNILEEVLIDGTTQTQYGSASANVCATNTSASYMRVEINPSGSFSIFTLNSTNPSIIKGLSLGGVTSPTTNGIMLNGDAQHWVYCNHIGVNAQGSAQLLVLNGVCISCSSPFGDNGLIGTNSDGIDDVAERNVITASTGINNNVGNNYVVAGNYFNLSADGLTGLISSQCVYVRQASFNNTYGSNLDGINDEIERNIIGSCQTAFNMDVKRGGVANTIAGNWIGVNSVGQTLTNGVQSAIKLQNTGAGTTTYIVKDNWINSITNAAIVVENGTKLDVSSSNNCITNTSIGITYAGTLLNMPFMNNYWGHASGPSGVGAGTGAEALELNTGIISYSPWLTTFSTICLKPIDVVYEDSFE